MCAAALKRREQHNYCAISSLGRALVAQGAALDCTDLKSEPAPEPAPETAPFPRQLMFDFPTDLVGETGCLGQSRITPGRTPQFEQHARALYLQPLRSP